MQTVLANSVVLPQGVSRIVLLANRTNLNGTLTFDVSATCNSYNLDKTKLTIKNFLIIPTFSGPGIDTPADSFAYHVYTEYTSSNNYNSSSGVLTVKDSITIRAYRTDYGSSFVGSSGQLTGCTVYLMF